MALLAIGLCFALSDCRSQKSADAAFEDIKTKIHHGEIPAAVQESDAEYHRYAEKQPQQAWRFRIQEAQLLAVEGKSKDALDLIREELPSSLASGDLAARRKMVQGLAMDFSRDYPAAENNLQQAERLSCPHDPELLDEVLLCEGILSVDEGKYSQAEGQFRAALSLARERNYGPNQLRALGSLGNVAMWEEHYDEAVDWYKASLEGAESSGATDASATTLGNLGWSYSALGDFENALDYFEQAEKASTKTGLERGQVEWLINIGDAHYQLHDYAPARAAYEQALVLANRIDYQIAEVECYDDLAEEELDAGRVDEARKSSEQAVALMGSTKDHFVEPYSRLILGRTRDAAKNYAGAERMFRGVIRDKLAGTSLHWEAEARLAKTLADEREPSKAETEFKRAIQTIEAARASVQTESFRLSFLSSAIDFYSDYIDFLVSRGKIKAALEVVELSRAHSLVESAQSASSEYTLPIKGFQPTETARRLRSVILSYWLGTRKSYLWVVTPQKIELVTLPAASEIDPLVQAYRRELVGPLDPLQSQNPNGQKLYDLLVAPVRSLISAGALVTILPDGALYDLNFEALLDRSPSMHYWIDDVTVEYGNSLVLLADSARHAPVTSKSLLLIGDPVSANPEYPKLPQAASEMDAVERFFPAADRDVFSGARATPNAYLKNNPGKFGIIHFVAHGVASRTSPLDSAVVLSSDGDSYKLYAREIISQRLHARLVTISACHGAGARTYSGEGLVGLAWAFLRAGARSVIAALWDVNDNSTAQLMSRMYAAMDKGVPPATALRDAKLAFVHSGNIYRKPFYWAAFQFYRGS